jgi:hypothetical protein
LKLARFRADYLWENGRVALNSWEGKLLGGMVAGRLALEASDKGSIMEIQGEASHLGASEICYAAGFPGQWVRGDAYVQFHLRGHLTDNVEFEGTGRGQLRKARLTNVPYLVLLGGYLNRPEFKDLEITQCEVDYVVKNGRLDFSNVQFSVSGIRLMGSGWFHPGQDRCEINLKSTIDRDFAGQFPSKVWDGGSRNERGDVELPLRVWGSSSRLQSVFGNRLDHIFYQAVGGSIFDKLFDAVQK